MSGPSTEMVQGFLDDYARAPWDWEDVTPAPGDIWYNHRTGPSRYVKNVRTGVILAVPEE
jgi:hypothetical protein